MNTEHGVKQGQSAAQWDEFTPDQLARVDAIIREHQSIPASLITVLETIQEHLGYIPKSIQKKVAAGLGVPLSTVYGVVTFYHFFTMVPRGRHVINCCMGTACYVRGGKGNLERLTRDLGIQPGQTTEDRRFSVETVRCLGACGLAPVMTVGETTYKQVKPARLAEILKNHE